MHGILCGVDEIDLRQIVSVDALLETDPSARLQIHRVFLPHHLESNDLARYGNEGWRKRGEIGVGWVRERKECVRVCVSMCVCMYVYVSVRMCVCVCVHTRVEVRAFTHNQLHILP